MSNQLARWAFRRLAGLHWLARVIRRRNALIGSVLFVLLTILAILAPVLAPRNPNEIAISLQFLPPSSQHLFGTDNFGRDMFSRMLYGTRVSLFVGASVAGGAGIIGAAIGLLAGYYRELDNPLMRIMDGLMAFPAILLGIAIMGTIGPSLLNVTIALTVVYIPRVARVGRGEALALAARDFVMSARSLGCSEGRILARHILPNCMALFIVQATFTFAYAILAEAALSFLGIGAPPEVPSWGIMLSEGRIHLPRAPWLVLMPGTAIVFAVLSLNLVGDGLRDALDPRLRGVVG